MKKHQLTRRIIAPVGRGRSGKTLLSGALYDEMHDRGELVNAWDLDKAPSLSLRIKAAKRATDASDGSRRSALEDAIHETIGGDADAVVDMGADDLLFHEIAYKLPGMAEILAQNGVEVVGIHVLGPQVQKDLAFFRDAKDKGIFARQIVVLNHGLVPSEIDPNDAFVEVRKLAKGFPIYPIRTLPPAVIDVLNESGGSMHDLASDPSALRFINMQVLRIWLATSIVPVVEEIMAVPLPEAA
jgi:hypothetical protein